MREKTTLSSQNEKRWTKGKNVAKAALTGALLLTPATWSAQETRSFEDEQNRKEILVDATNKENKHSEIVDENINSENMGWNSGGWGPSSWETQLFMTQDDFQSLMDWLSDEEKEKLSKLSDDQVMEFLDMLRQKYNKKREMYGNRNLIIKDLEENHVKVEENVEMMWYKWKIFHINLPAVWNFKWFKFDCFVSDELVSKENLEGNQKLLRQSYLVDDIVKLWLSIKDYLKEYWAYWDVNMYLRSFMNLYKSYRSKNKESREFFEDDLSNLVRIRNNIHKDSNHLLLNPNK